MASGKIDWVRISAIFGIVASLGGMAGFLFSKDTQRCVGLNGTYRGHPLRAIAHCTDDRTSASVISQQPARSDGTSTEPRQVGGTQWVFYVGDTKTNVTFNADGTLTFSDPAYGAGGMWQLAGTRGIAFHTDAYEFGGTIGRGVPDRFEVSYRHLPRGAKPEPQMTSVFTRI